jgi:L-asparaginase
MLILATGGTFDKNYDIISGQLTFAGSQLPDLIRQARLTCPHQLEIIMQKDSLEMTLSDRMTILEHCRQHSSQHILVIHGTDTMTKTAVFLQQAQLAKTIVLTGAMRPVALGDSDGVFNFGYALAMTQSQPHGVYIAMQGQCFAANQVIKDRTQALFTNK